VGLSHVHARFGWHGRSKSAIPFCIGSGVVTTKEILEKYKTIAVVGLSSTLWKASFGVSEYMKAAGYRIIPVNPNETEVLGEKAYATLEDVPVPIEIVNIFRRPEYVPEIVESAIRLKAKVIWMQLGVVNEAAAARARAAGLEVVMDRCILQDHSALF
jgi:predicted CoA-binding protein